VSTTSLDEVILLIARYDAITINNKVDYQNSLSLQNVPFAKSCGRVLTNYCWKEADVHESKEVAQCYNMYVNPSRRKPAGFFPLCLILEILRLTLHPAIDPSKTSSSALMSGRKILKNSPAPGSLTVAVVQIRELLLPRLLV
jgi:hypothetical protein